MIFMSSDSVAKSDRQCSSAVNTLRVIEDLTGSATLSLCLPFLCSSCKAVGRRGVTSIFITIRRDSSRGVKRWRPTPFVRTLVYCVASPCALASHEAASFIYNVSPLLPKVTEISFHIFVIPPPPLPPDQALASSALIDGPLRPFLCLHTSRMAAFFLLILVLSILQCRSFSFYSIFL